MNKFSFKEGVYSLAEIVTLRRVSHLHKSGDVTNLQTGEVLDIQDIDKWKSVYIGDLMNDTEKEKVIKNKDKTDKLRLYEEKFTNKTIKKDELLELIKIKDSKHFEINYKSYFLTNCEKERPTDLSPSDYGRFYMLLDFMSFKNKITHSNGKVIKEVELMASLKINTLKTFRNFISRLSIYGMMAKNKVGGKTFIHINPVYVRRKIKLDETIYQLFKEDLREYLNDYEIMYFEMDSDVEEGYISSTIELV